jgi:hypothetical protein
MRATFAFSVFSSISVLVACSAAPGENAEQVGQASSTVTASSFVTVTAAARGGFEVTSVNTGVTSHVARIDYSKAGLSEETIAAVEALPTTELLLQGSATSSAFVVTTAFRGMPGITYGASATFYEAAGATAHALNESVTRAFDSVDVTAASKPFVSQSWLANEATTDGAIVAGHVTEGAKVLTADQVFIALPYTGGPCVITSHVCPDATPAATYTRDPNLCLDFAACVAPGVCALPVPACAAGYTLESWASGPRACPQYACDPSFIHGS